ncbi:hypothetical protein AncyloWKF20_11300 [Ancylobacter sp. WKF20]|uniref:hypothetical protein n=1 Tax=Ancylobacter sp. WKF20 TaxID=3039801 RepID=UPI0024346469|nr:hypothetical protein [Ancylobacter sp. WKF20]WGD28406.1 hypothetical protein AncyloWKF20_11300 [Ancylobacter sp. WKF20]
MDRPPRWRLAITISSDAAAAPDADFRRIIERRLSSPQVHGDLETLLSALHWTDLTLVMTAPPLMEELPDLGDRFRGALGRRLEAMGPTGAEAWHLLFGPLFRAGSEEAIRPYAIAAHRERDAIIWRLRLFGFADLWAEEIEAAMRLAPVAGIALRRSGMQRVPLDIRSVTRALSWWASPPHEARRVRMTTITPLIIRRSRSTLGSLDGLHSSIIRRLLAVARWCDAAASRSLLADLRSDVWSLADETLSPVGWVRHSSNHPEGVVNLGLSGHFLLSDLTPIGNRLTQSALLFHAGGGATAGFGWLTGILL